MLISRKAIELGDLFEFDSNIVQIVEMEELPQLTDDIEFWKQKTRNLTVSIKYLAAERIVAVKIESLKPIPIWYPSVDFTTLLGFEEVEFPGKHNLQIQKLQNILLFKILFEDKDGYLSGTSYSIGHINDLDKIEKYSHEINLDHPEIKSKFEKEFTPINDLNTLLSGLKLYSVGYDINSVKDYFYHFYLPAKYLS